MTQTASRKDFIPVEFRLLVAFELGWEKWRLAFATAVGEKPWQVVIQGRTAQDPGLIRASKETLDR
jgi:hypothetical protein